MIFRCSKCKTKREISTATICVINNKIETKEALCKCGTYMKQIITDEYKGMPDIIRNERNNK